MKKPLLLLSISALLFACKDSEPDPEPTPEPTPLVANAVADANATLGSTVTLDGSTSTGPDGFTYEWSYAGTEVPESEINFQNKTSAKATFVPPTGAVYSFKLRVSAEGQIREDQVEITVNGAKRLAGQISGTFVFEDVEPDPSKPDYKVAQTIVIKPESAPILQGLVFEFAEGAGLEIRGNANLANVTFTSPTHWKGILVTDFYMLTMDHVTIENAGTGLFAGETESAAITNNIGSITMTNSTFIGTTGYDVLSNYPVELHGNVLIAKTVEDQCQFPGKNDWK